MPHIDDDEQLSDADCALRELLLQDSFKTKRLGHADRLLNNTVMYLAKMSQGGTHWETCYTQHEGCALMRNIDLYLSLGDPNAT